MLPFSALKWEGLAGQTNVNQNYQMHTYYHGNRVCNNNSCGEEILCLVRGMHFVGYISWV